MSSAKQGPGIDIEGPGGHWFVQASAGILNQCWHHVRMARIPDSLLAGFGALVGASISGLEHPDIALLVAMVCVVVLLSGASMIFNDWCDVPGDTINKPQRPIPSGQVTRHGALAMAVALFGLAICFAVAVGPTVVLAVAAIVAGSVAYSMFLKKVPLLGNLAVGVIAACPFWLWLPLIPDPPAACIALILALICLNTGREVAGTAADVVGDRACGIRTVATMGGAETAASLGVILGAVAMGLSWLPVWFGAASWTYVAALAISTGMVLTLPLRTAGAGGPQRCLITASTTRMIAVIMAVACLLGIRTV